MNKRLLLVAVGIALLAAGCGKSSSPAAVDNQTTPAASNNTATTQGQGSFKDLIGMGKPLKCDSSFTEQGNTSSGTMYLAGGKMRGDFSAQVQGKTMQSHMIVKDQTSYSWVEGLGTTMGFKMAINPSNTPQGQPASPSAKSVNMDQQVSYNCQPWTEDDSQFALPSGVNFQDESQMMAPKAPVTAAPPAPGGGNPAACAACNSAPASSKAQCLAALGCK